MWGRRTKSFTVMLHGPTWVIHVARPLRGLLPWSRMVRATLGVGVPLAAGLITGGTAPGILVGLGGLAGAIADRPGTHRLRARAISLAGAGGAVGLFLGTLIHGRGWLAVAVLVLVAGASALISAAGDAWPETAFCLLVYAVLGAGPLGALQPWWVPIPFLLTGLCWSLLLSVAEWLLTSRMVDRPRPRVVRRTGASAPTPGRGAFPRRLPVLVQQARLTFSAVSGFRLMLCIAVAALVSEVLPLGRSYWVVLAVALVGKPDFGSIFARAMQYAGTTVVGAVIGGLLIAAGPPEAVLLAPAVVLAALLPVARSRQYGAFVLVLTPVVILLVDTPTSGGLAPAVGRLVDVVLGCAIVLAIGYAPWRWTWRSNPPRAFARAVDRAADYLDSTLPTSVADPPATAQARAHKELAALRMEFRRAMAEPEPARRQVLAWKPVADVLEQLLDAVTTTRTSGAEPPLPTEVAQVNETLRDIGAAARSGSAAPPEPSLTTSPPLEHVSESVRALWRALQRALPSADAASVLRPTRLPDRGE